MKESTLSVHEFDPGRTPLFPGVGKRQAVFIADMSDGLLLEHLNAAIHLRFLVLAELSTRAVESFSSLLARIHRGCLSRVFAGLDLGRFDLGLGWTRDALAVDGLSALIAAADEALLVVFVPGWNLRRAIVVIQRKSDITIC